jgi:hypothetical protein
VDTEILSEREMEVLEIARKEIKSCAPWDVAHWLHTICPEWQDPNGSSRPIDPDVILRNAGRTDEEIRVFKESNQTYSQTKKLLEAISKPCTTG